MATLWSDVGTIDMALGSLHCQSFGTVLCDFKLALVPSDKLEGSVVLLDYASRLSIRRQKWATYLGRQTSEDKLSGPSSQYRHLTKVDVFFD